MSVLTMPLPDAVTEDEARLLLAIKLFEVGKVSCGKAAELAGRPKREFMKILGEHRIPVFNYSPEDLDRDVKNA